MRPKHGCKANQTQQRRQLNPLNPLLGMIRQPAPQIGRKNTADLKQRHENANICSRELLRLQIQAPIRHECADEEVINEVKTGKIEMKGVAQGLIFSMESNTLYAVIASQRFYFGVAIH